MSYVYCVRGGQVLAVRPDDDAVLLPDFRIEQTGGGCTASVRYPADGTVVVLTDGSFDAVTRDDGSDTYSGAIFSSVWDWENGEDYVYAADGTLDTVLSAVGQQFVSVPFKVWLQAATWARDTLKHADALSPLDDTHVTDEREVFILSTDRRSGYMLTSYGDLRQVFSTVPGRGDALVRDAVARGARTLDCFDGYLTRLYARNGFVEYERVANWAPTGPDVVYMKIRADESGCPNGHGCGAAHRTWQDCP